MSDQTILTPRTDSCTGHCVCNATPEADVCPRSEVVKLERELITERELRVAAEKALENAGVPIELEWEEPLTLAQRIEWLHTAKGLSDARLEAFKRIYAEKLTTAEQSLAALQARVDEAMGLLSHIVAEGRGREFFPRNLDGSTNEMFIRAINFTAPPTKEEPALNDDDGFHGDEDEKP